MKTENVDLNCTQKSVNQFSDVHNGLALPDEKEQNNFPLLLSQRQRGRLCEPKLMKSCMLCIMHYADAGCSAEQSVLSIMIYDYQGRAKIDFFQKQKRRLVIKIRLYSGFLRKNRIFRLFEVLSPNTVGILYCHLCSHVLLNLEGKDGPQENKSKKYNTRRIAFYLSFKGSKSKRQSLTCSTLILLISIYLNSMELANMTVVLCREISYHLS